jgi:flagellar assembly protein FliH
MENLKSQLLVDHERELIQLVFQIAKKIALRDLEGNHEAIRETLVNVVAETKANERIVVRLSVEDMQFLETLQEKSGQHIESLERVKFVPESKIKSGGCVIETEFGSVDATVEERVERIWQTLASRMPQTHRPGQE